MLKNKDSDKRSCGTSIIVTDMVEFFYLFNLCICTSVIFLQKSMVRVVGLKSTNFMATKNFTSVCFVRVQSVTVVFC